MPVGSFLHGGGQLDQRVIHSRSPDDLQRNWHGAIVKPRRDHDGGKAEKVRQSESTG